jgi:hypothetical protein
MDVNTGSKIRKAIKMLAVTGFKFADLCATADDQGHWVSYAHDTMHFEFSRSNRRQIPRKESNDD